MSIIQYSCTTETITIRIQIETGDGGRTSAISERGCVHIFVSVTLLHLRTFERCIRVCGTFRCGLLFQFAIRGEKFANGYVKGRRGRHCRKGRRWKGRVFNRRILQDFSPHDIARVTYYFASIRDCAHVSVWFSVYVSPISMCT